MPSKSEADILLEDLPPALSADIVRYNVKKFSGGREDLLPDDIDDPELLLRAVVRRFHAECSSAKSQQYRAEAEADKLRRQVEILEEAQALAKEREAKFGNPERKLAKAAQSELFNERMTIRRLQKELRIVKEMLKESEDTFTQLFEDLVTTRRKDQELEDAQNGLENTARMSVVALAEERKKVHEKTEIAKKLKARVQELEENEGDVHRTKAIAERRIVVLDRDIAQLQQDVKRIEVKYQESVETMLILEERCREEEAKLKEERAKVEVLTAQIAEEKKWNSILKQDLAKAQSEIEGVTDEKNSLFKENKSLDKKGIMEGKRAREAEAEAKKVRELLVDSSSNLVMTTHELGDEKLRVSDLEHELEKTRNSLKEYQDLAATRKGILEGVEKEVVELTNQLKDVEAREYSLTRELKKLKVSLSQSMGREKDADAEVVRVASSLDVSQREFHALQSQVGDKDSSIELLQSQLQDSKELVRIYRLRGDDLETDLKASQQRVSESQDREYLHKVECDRLKEKLVKEQAVVSDLSEKVELMSSQIQESQAAYVNAVQREEVLKEQVSRFEEKLQDATERGDVLEKGLKHVEGEREVYKGQTHVLREDLLDKQTKLRSTNKDLTMTAVDLESLKESHEGMAEDLKKSRKQYAEAALRVESLEKECQEAKAQLEIKERQAARLEVLVEELNVKLEDAILEYTEERKQAKDYAEKLHSKDSQVKKIATEATFSKDSVQRLCGDIKQFQDREAQLKDQKKSLEGEIEKWKQRLEVSQGEVSELKDVNWRIAEDLQKSKVSLRELEAMVKKTTTELKSGKGRMLEAEARNIELSANVTKLMEALVQAEAREKEALDLLAEGKGPEKERKKKKMQRSRTTASMEGGRMAVS